MFHEKQVFIKDFGPHQMFELRYFVSKVLTTSNGDQLITIRIRLQDRWSKKILVQRVETCTIEQLKDWTKDMKR